MKIMAVDDEKNELEMLTEKITGACPGADLVSYQNPKEALEQIQEEAQKPDLIFLDVRMGTMSGLDFAREIRKENKHTAIVFVTKYSEYTMDAFSLKANGYLLKPVTNDQIKQEITYVQELHKMMPKPSEKKVRVQCFGNFEVFKDGRPVTFKRAKSKELFAYLIDRNGAFCTNGELIGALWEDSINQSSNASNLRTIEADMLKVFADEKDLFIKKRGRICIVPERVDCDYYNWKMGDDEAINAYNGEYMSQYSWAECTLGELYFQL